MALGIGQAGNEKAFLQVIDDVCERFPAGVTYVEVGVAEGDTLIWVADRLKERLSDWRAVGIELPEGYSFRVCSLINNVAGKHRVRFIKEEVADVNNPKEWHALTNGITVVLAPAQAVFRRHWNYGLPIHLVLLDGCHGDACVRGEFLAVEPMLETGGYVLFHDFGTDSIGEPQPHCGVGNTRGACRELELISGRRPNWVFEVDNKADKTKGGFDLGGFRKL